MKNKKYFISLTFLVGLFFFEFSPQYAKAGKFDVLIVNEIDDKDDPICLKAVNFTLGKVEDISHKIDEPIGKEFKIIVNMPTVPTPEYGDYLKKLSEEGKELDSLVLASKTRKIKILLSDGRFIQPVDLENMSSSYLPSMKGIQLLEKKPWF